MAGPKETTLSPLDEDNIGLLLELAVAMADPSEVMPPVPGPPGWTQHRMNAFREFYLVRVGGLDNALSTAAYAIHVGGQIAGMIRMSRHEPAGTIETGMFLGRDFRGQGVGTAALRALLVLAAEAGAHTVIADTTAGNVAALGALRRLGAVFTETPEKIYARIPIPVVPNAS